MYATCFAPLRRALLPLAGLLPTLLFLMVLTAPPATAATPTITYTGQLLASGGTPVANGHYDFQFGLYTAATGGSQVGSTLSVGNVLVEDGVFYVELNFGSSASGATLYLQTAYRVTGGGAYTTQSPRKLIPTTSYADYAATAGTAKTATTATTAATATVANSTKALQGKAISTTAPTTGQVLEWTGTLWTPTTFSSGGTYTAGNGLHLTGNQFSVAVPLALSGSSNPIISATNTGGTTGSLGTAFYGVRGTGTGILTGVRGENSSDGAGVTGFTATGYGVYGSASGSGYGVYGTSPSGYGVYGTSSGGFAGYFSGGGSDGLYAETTATDGNGVLGVANSGTSAYGVEGTSANGYGVVGSGGAIGVYGACAGGPGVYAYGGGTSVNRPAVYAYNANGNGIGIYSITNSTDANLVVTNGGGGDLIRAFAGGNNLYFRVTANGTTITRVLQITGGADVAEPYTVGAAGDVQPLPGMVVSIDPDHIGQMVLAHAAYDRTVAGILSGGGGIQPGLTLRQKDTVADGTLPVACTGRVWCFCDAGAGGAIAAGDLLTTSGTPGHAMKASDDRRSRGAILGKAMSSLPSGKGLVLVLVTLQ